MFYNNIDKLIYTDPVFNGKYDPLAVYRKLILAEGGLLNSRLFTWSDDKVTDVDRALAEESIVRITRESFGLKPFTEVDGVTDGVALTILQDFLEWLRKNG